MDKLSTLCNLSALDKSLINQITLGIPCALQHETQRTLPKWLPLVALASTRIQSIASSAGVVHFTTLQTMVWN